MSSTSYASRCLSSVCLELPFLAAGPRFRPPCVCLEKLGRLTTQVQSGRLRELGMFFQATLLRCLGLKLPWCVRGAMSMTTTLSARGALPLDFDDVEPSRACEMAGSLTCRNTPEEQGFSAGGERRNTCTRASPSPRLAQKHTNTTPFWSKRCPSMSAAKLGTRPM